MDTNIDDNSYTHINKDKHTDINSNADAYGYFAEYCDKYTNYNKDIYRYKDADSNTDRDADINRDINTDKYSNRNSDSNRNRDSDRNMDIHNNANSNNNAGCASCNT